MSNAVPTDTLGIYITDYNTAFSIDTLSVTSGSVSFYLKESPVFVEEYNPTSVNDIIFNDNIKIYPNPTNGIFTIQCKDIQSIKIININGQIIKQLSIDNEQFTIDLSNQPKGIYFVKIKGDDFIIVKKIVIQ